MTEDLRYATFIYFNSSTTRSSREFDAQTQISMNLEIGMEQYSGGRMALDTLKYEG